MKDLREQIGTHFEIVEKAGSALPQGVIMQIKGKFGHAGKITANGRLYGTPIINRELGKMEAKLESRSIIGEADHPDIQKGSSVRQSAFIITGLGLNADSEIMGEADVVDTSAGRDFAALVRAGAQVGISSRGRGSSKQVKMTSEHPAFEVNREWEGKMFDEVDEDFELKTFDAVIGPAVADAHIANFNEKNSEENMDLKDLLKNESLMDGLMKSDFVLGKIAEAVEASKAEMQKSFDENIKTMVAEHLASDEFAKNFKVETEDDGDKEDEKVEKIKCQHCDTELNEGVAFCSSCGRVVTPKEEAKTPDEKDVVIEELKGRLDALESANKEKADELSKMQQAEKDRQDEIEVDKIMAESLKGKSALIAERVRSDVKELKATPETAKEMVEKRLGVYEGLEEALGTKFDVKGSGKNIPNDVDDTSEELERLDEKMLGSLMR
jgi:hypothetical protein